MTGGLAALSLAETKRLVRHPLLLAGAAAGALLALGPWVRPAPNQGWASEHYVSIPLLWVGLYLGCFLAANMTALRDTDTLLDEVRRCTPLRTPDHVTALLMAGAAPVAVATALAVAQSLIVRRAGGIWVDLALIKPTAIEMALVPMIALTAHAAGIALATKFRWRLVAIGPGTLVICVLFLQVWIFDIFPIYLVHPFATAINMEDRDLRVVLWHLVYLAGATLLLSAYAVHRSGPGRRVRHLVALGSLLVVGGLTAQAAVMEWARSYSDILP